MLQVGTKVRVKQNAYEGSGETNDIAARGQTGEIILSLEQQLGEQWKDCWEVLVAGDILQLTTDEIEEIEATMSKYPSTKLRMYPLFQEIANEIKARPEADLVDILDEYVSPLVDACNKINQWMGQYPTWDFTREPPWYEAFLCELARFDVDLSPIWEEARGEAAKELEQMN